MHWEMAPLDDCVDRALDALAIRLQETGAQLTRDPLPELRGDRTLLTQLYQNLICNALKFVRGRRPQIRLTAELNDGCWTLGVRDNGIGIAPEYRRQIFGPFQRLHGRGEFDGAGVGLAICQTTVERHGGAIWVESQPGIGSHFKFTLSGGHGPADTIPPPLANLHS
jgi:signal transduction histidine kinase